MPASVHGYSTPAAFSRTCAVICVSVQASVLWCVPIFPPLSSKPTQEGGPATVAASEQGFEELVQEGILPLKLINLANSCLFLMTFSPSCYSLCPLSSFLSSNLAPPFLYLFFPDNLTTSQCHLCHSKDRKMSINLLLY